MGIVLQGGAQVGRGVDATTRGADIAALLGHAEV